MKKVKIELDYAAADAITLANLKQYRKAMKFLVKRHLKHGEYMHPEDLQQAQADTIPALDILITQYGG